jgi:mitogen-activated protein kinase kinase kinase 13
LMIITELAQYGTLTDYINQNKNQGHDWEINYDFIRQITLGLTYLHKSKVVHRDLKSPNILICEGAIAKIADFGLSKEIDDLTISKTASKGILGTPRWMAPEVLKSEKYSFASDIYSLGMVIWEIVAQETVPFRQFNNNNTVMFNVGSGLKETVPIDSPKALKEIIEKCWKTKPEERISLAEIKSKIEETSIIKERVGSDDEFYDANESFSETGNQEELIEQFAQIQIPS